LTVKHCNKIKKCIQNKQYVLALPETLNYLTQSKIKWEENERAAVF
jgi:hypothetical protein